MTTILFTWIEDGVIFKRKQKLWKVFTSIFCNILRFYSGNLKKGSNGRNFFYQKPFRIIKLGIFELYLSLISVFLNFGNFGNFGKKYLQLIIRRYLG